MARTSFITLSFTWSPPNRSTYVVSTVTGGGESGDGAVAELELCLRLDAGELGLELARGDFALLALDDDVPDLFIFWDDSNAALLILIVIGAAFRPI